MARLLITDGDEGSGHAWKLASGNHPDLLVYRTEGKSGMHSIDGILMDDGDPASVRIENGAMATVIFNCTTGAALSAGRFKSDITFKYMDLQNGRTFPVSGSIQANAR